MTESYHQQNRNVYIFTLKDGLSRLDELILLSQLKELIV